MRDRDRKRGGDTQTGKGHTARRLGGGSKECGKRRERMGLLMETGGAWVGWDTVAIKEGFTKGRYRQESRAREEAWARDSNWGGQEG